MKAVIQRVTQASVTVDNNVIGKINNGIMILLGVGKEDTYEDVVYLADKIMNLRIFSDENDKMNLSVRDINGSLLVISQFTLYGDCKKGRRPSFDMAGSPDTANRLYKDFIKYCKETGMNVEAGEFGADMKVSLLNDGPVTLILESKGVKK